MRFTACNLRCTYCDTEYAFKEGRFRSIDDLVEETVRHGTRLVEITGGEPLLQPRVHDLVERLCDLDRTVLIETSGAYALDDVDPRAIVIADLKCPGSGEAARNLWPTLAALRPIDELKIVVADEADLDWALARLDDELRSIAATVLWSPVHGELAPATLAAWLLERRAPGRMQVQLHKVIWPDAERGV